MEKLTFVTGLEYIILKTALRVTNIDFGYVFLFYIICVSSSKAPPPPFPPAVRICPHTFLT
jgi:hypothetical protein